MVEISLTLTFDSPFSIRSGARRGTFANRGILKDRDGWPYVPASALKGRLRHEVEQLLRATPGRRVCATHRDMCANSSVLCDVCAIFGSPVAEASIRFVNLPLSGPAELLELRKRPNRPPRTDRRMGVAINRQRRVAEDQLLYSTELFYPGVPLEFSGLLQGRLTRTQTAVLVAAIRAVSALGQGKTGGLGWISAEVSVRSGEEIWTDEVLRRALSEGTTDAG